MRVTTDPINCDKFKQEMDFQDLASKYLGPLLSVLLAGSVLYGCGGQSIKPHIQPLAQSQVEQTTAKTLEWLGEKVGFFHNKSSQALLRRVVAKLDLSAAQVCMMSSPSLCTPDSKNKGDFALTNPLRHWKVILLASHSPVAFSAGNGLIFISRGVIVHLESEAELAAVISHEMAHHLLGHTQAEIKSPEEIKNEENPKNLEIPKQTAAEPVLHYNPEEEFLADALGMKIMALANYRPSAALTALTSAYGPTIDTDIPLSKEERGILKTRIENLSRLSRELTSSSTYSKGVSRSISSSSSDGEFQRVRNLLETH